MNKINTSRVKLEGTIRSFKQPGNRSMPRHKVKGVPSNGIIIVSDARIDDLIGRWLMNYV